MRTARSSSRRGGLHQAPPPGPDPPGAGTPPGTKHPPDQAPPRMRHPPGSRPPPVDRHTPVNILPCPKLRLRAVKINAFALGKWSYLEEFNKLTSFELR